MSIFRFLSLSRGKESPSKKNGKRPLASWRRFLDLERLEDRTVPSSQTFNVGSYIVDMGQSTQTIGNALKPYGLVYDLVTNLKVPVDWAINPAKTTFRLDAGNPIPVDFTATITTGTKSYSGGSFIIDASLLTPVVIAEINNWKAQGVVVDQLAAQLTTEIYGQITSFPHAVLDLQNGALALPYYANAGIPSSSYEIGNPTDLNQCDDVYILPHADPQSWSDTWKQALFNFVDQGGGLWAGCHAVSALEALTSFTVGGVTQRLNFLSNDLIPWGSHSAGTLPYSYNPAAANDPIMQIMNRLDGATTNGSEQIYVPTTLDWRSTTTVAVYDPDHPNNPLDGTSPYNDAAAVAYGHAFGDPTKGLVMYEAGHSLAKATAAANIAAQRAFFNFILTEGIAKAPQANVSMPPIVAGQAATITATISGGSGTYNYQWISSNGGIFSNPAGTWHVGDPPITTQYLMTSAQDTIRLAITDVPCGRQGLFYETLVDTPPTIDLDLNNSTGATGADYKGYFQGNSTIVPAADTDVQILDNGTTIHSAAIKLTTRPDGTAETLLLNEALAASYGISVVSDGAGGFLLSGTATLAQYQAVIASLQYVNALAFPTSTDRVITVMVNDGISNSNTAVSRLSYLGTAVTANKNLYLSDPAQGMDRVDPVATSDTTTSSVSVVPAVSNDSTGMATWSNSARKNMEYRPWLLTGYGTQGTVAADGGSYITMTSAASPKRNEAIVVGVTSDRHVSGSIWNGSTWTPIKINIGGTLKTNLGAPSAANYWGAAVAYETNSGRAMLVWNTGSTLNYSIWNGTSWTAAASIPAYTGTEPQQIRIAANPLAGSNEMVLVVTSKNEVDRALVWNGSTWGNAIQLDNDTGHNLTDMSVAYEQQSGRAMVTYASGTTGNVAYNIWNGATWSTAATIAAPAGSNNYAQWTVLAADPNSNRLVLGVESNGQDAWMNVWDGAVWGTATVGATNTVDNVNNLEIAVAFESKSGEALAVYQNNESTNTTELQYRTWNSGTGWSTGTNFGSFVNKVSRSVTLRSNPYSDQIQLLVNDDAKILRSDLWGGSSFAAPIQLESNTNTQLGQPFTFFWDRYVPGTVTTETTFTQTTPMTSPFMLPSGGAVKVTTYIQLTSGTLPASPKLAVSLGQSGNSIATLTTSPTVTNLGGGNYKLVWTGTMPSTATVPAGGQISLTLLDYDSTYSFNILYDSTTFPSQVQLATATAITINSAGVYGAAYPAGSQLTTTEAGQPAYVRFTVSDPFGASDITGADLLIKNSLGGTVVAASLTNANVVASTAGSKTYEYAWTPLTADNFTITITAHEGTEGVTATAQTPITTTAHPDLVVTKSDGGATVTPGGSVAYTLNYANTGLGNATGVIITEFLPAGATFNAAGSTPGWAAVGSSEFRFAVGTLAAGASGSVVFSVNVPSPAPSTLEQLQNISQIADDGTHGADVNPNNNTSEDTTPVNAAPDLVVTKTDGGTSTLAGGIVLYQISYTNTGTQDAADVVLQEMLPANTTFNGTYSIGEWDAVGGDAYVLTVGNLPVGASGTAIFAVTVISPLPGGVTSISNTASISDSGLGGPDLNPGNNTSTDSTPISNNPQADLQITKTNGATSVTPGNVVTYTITVTNAGPNVVTGAAFNDTLPTSLAGVSYTTAVTGGAVATPAVGSGNTINGLLDLPGGSTVTYTVTGTLDPDATGTLTNLASVTPPSGVVDPNTGNNTAIDADPIVPVSDLSLLKSYTYTDLDGSGTLTPGDQIVFALTATNSGPNTARNVSVQDLLPNGYQYVSDDAALNGGTYSFGSGLWSIGSIGASAPNNTAVLHITATVSAGGSHTNVAEISSSDSFDPDSTPGNSVPTEDDYQSVTPTIQPKSDLSLEKTMALTSDLDGNGILSIGDRVTFTLSLNNAGPDAATGVHVADLLPAGYSFFSYTASPGTYNSATGDWNVGTVNVLSTATLSVTATITGGHPVSAYANYAQVSASGHFDPDSTPGNGSTTEDDNASFKPEIADLSVTKTVAFAPGGDLDVSGTPTAGDQIIFTVTVSNAGPDYATGVRLVDQLPNGYTYDSDDGASAYDPVSGMWNIGAMAPGTTRTLNITAIINASGSYTNTAQVTASQQFDLDSTPNNNVSSEDDQASASLTLGPPAYPPVAVNDSSLHNTAGPVTLNVTANDTDPNLDLVVSTVDLDPATAGQQTSRTVAGQGTWTVDTLGNVTFTPQAGFTQDPTPINYTVQDSGGRTSNQASITIDYVPVASPDTSSGNTTSTAVTINVLANDTTGDAVVPSTVQIVGTSSPGASLVVPGQGTWSVNTTTGAITFTPEPGYAGDPTPIQYTVQDNDGNTSSPATVTVDYNQYPPVAVNDNSLHNLPGPVTLNVTTNDTDPNNDIDPSTVDLDPATPGQQTIHVVADEGFWQVDSFGNVTFFPEVGFTHDPTPIPYTVSDATGLTSNQASITIDYVPVASPDASSGNTTGSPTTIDVLANDTTGDAVVPSTVQIVGTSSPGASLVVPGQGTWSVNTTTGAITFTPEPGYAGDPTPIQYTVQDNDGNTSSPATVTVDYNQYPPVAMSDSSLHNLPGPVTLNVTTNDTDSNGDLLVSTVDLDPFTPGQQTTLVVAGEGTWSADGSGNVTFTPEAGFTHDPTPINYTIGDATGLLSNEAIITIDYVPLAANDSSSGNAPGTAVTVPVLDNDTAGDAVVPSTVQIVGTPAPGNPLIVLGQGTWSINPATGAITFTPAPGFTGDPSPIQYTVQDNDGNISNPATVVVDYTQHPPFANDDSSLGNPPGPVTLNVTANDTDLSSDVDPSTVDLDPATPGQQTSLAVAGEGTWSADNSGNVTFTPEAGFTHDPTPISYEVKDLIGETSNQAIITIDYAPVASPDTSSGNPTGTAVTVPVLANDTTGDAVVPSTVQIVGTSSPGASLVVPGQGTWSVNTTTGAITFTPEPGFTGDPSPIQYTVQDNDGNTSSPATVTVDYNQYPPVAVNDNSLHNLPGPVTLNVTTNDTDPNGDLLISAVDLDPATAGQQTTLVVAGEGTWSVDGVGNVTFTPEAGFTHDPTPIPYTVGDSTGLISNQAIITIDYVPVASPDTSSGNPTGLPVTVPVLGNDTIGDAPVPSTVQIVGTSSPGASLVVPGQGTWSVNTTTGAITFTPEPGFTGDPSPIQYTVQDNDGNTSNPAAVVVDYNQYPPVAMNDSSLANLPGPVTLNVTTNDTDPNGDLLVSTVDLDPFTPGQQTTLVVAGEGTWSADGSGNVTFTPQAGFTHDPTPIPYTVSDATGLISNQATITIDYVPVASPDASSGNPTGLPVTVPVLGNDTIGDAPVPSTVQIVGTSSPGASLVVPGQGTWSVNTTTGAITFTPAPGFTGDPTPIQYTVQDNDGNTSSPATVTVDYNQYPPVAMSDSSLHNLPGPVTLNVTGNDLDPNNDIDPSTVDLDPATPGQQTKLVVASEGIWSVDNSGNVTFTPEAGFTHDPTPIPYTVSDSAGFVSNEAFITIDYVPVATSDSSSGNAPGTAVTVPVLDNDTAGDAVVPSTVQIVGTANPGDPLVVPGQGKWTVDTTIGAITFTPELGFTGEPTPIQYIVQDNDGNISYPATVVVSYNQHPPLAIDDGSLHNAAGPVTLNVTANDTDPGSDLLPSTVDVDPSTPGQQTSLAVAGEGTWSADNSGNVTFTPEAGFTHDPTPIPYTVSDSAGFVSNEAFITIDYVPVASPDTSSGNVTGSPVTIDVLANDKTGDAVMPSTVQIVGTLAPGASLVVPGQGTWSVNTTTGAITFTPEPGYAGDPTPIQYTVKDNDGNTSNPATVTVDYNQHPPVAVNDSSLHNLPGAVTLNVTTNDTDPGSDLLPSTVDVDPSTPGQQTSLAVAGEGTWSADNSGNVTFTPEAGFTHDPTPINYTVSDATGLFSNIATISIDYVPVATSDGSSGNTTGSQVTVNVLGNDTTGDAAVPSTVQIVGTSSAGASLVVPGQGTWSINSTTGAITFTPEPSFTGDPAPIQYTVRDNDGNISSPATVTVDYNQHPPVAVNDNSTANLPGAVTLNVTTNDTDPGGDLLVSTVDLDPSTSGQQTTRTVAGEGTWSVDNFGNVTFTPQAGFTHDPTPINYTVSDATGLFSNIATISIDYVPVATSDGSSGNTPGSLVTVNVLGNDTTGDAVVPSTVQIVGTQSPGASLVVPGQGTWSVNPATGAITFTPEPGFTGDPTPIQYTVKDNDGNTSSPATVTVDYGQHPPLTVNDSSLHNAAGPVMVNVTTNDTDPGSDLLPSTVDLDPATPGRQTTWTVAGEGTWSADNSGNVTFTPQPGFTHDPTPIAYVVKDLLGMTSAEATITIDYVPVATSDGSSGNATGSPVTVPVLGNDTKGDVVVPSTVQIVGTSGPGASLVVPGQGTWSINPATGAITFTPQLGYTGDPTPIQYTVKDNDGNISNPATVTIDYVQTTQVADLSVTKSSGQTTAVPGMPISYTITVTNNGPSTVTSFTLKDTVPAALILDPVQPFTTSTGTYDSATGLWSGLNLASGQFVTMTVRGIVSPTATGTITNTVTVTPPPGTTDPVPGNNSDSDTGTLTPQVDLSITKDDGSQTEVPGTPVTYTVAVSNAGPSTVTAVHLSDSSTPSLLNLSLINLPAGASFNPGTGILSGITLAAGSTITFQITGLIPAGATGTLTDTITVTPLPGVTDTNPGNNGGTDVDTLTPQADLRITKTDAVDIVFPGQALAYFITVENLGPSNVIGARVTDVFAPEISSHAWFVLSATPGASATPSSGGVAADIDTFVTIPAGGVIVFQVDRVISAALTPPPGGQLLSNTAFVVVPSGVTDTNPNNNDDTHDDTILPVAQVTDLRVVKSHTPEPATPGQSVTYTITVTNEGPTAVTGGTVADTFFGDPGFAAFTSMTWQATNATLGAASLNGSGTGPLNDTFNMPVNASITYTITATVSPLASGVIVNEVQTQPPAGVTDSHSADNTAVDQVTLVSVADLAVTKDDGQTIAVRGAPINYTITVTNNGPSTVTSFTLKDTVPAALILDPVQPFTTSTGTYDSATGLWSGLNLASGQFVTMTVRGIVSPTATGTITNTVTVTPPPGTTDPVPGNNSDSDTDTLIKEVDVIVTKDDGVDTVLPGDFVTYTMVVRNAGPSNVNGVVVTDHFWAVRFSSATWTSTAAGGASGNRASGSGDIAELLNLPAGGSVTYIVRAQVNPTFGGILKNKITATVPQHITDTNPSNNIAVDRDQVPGVVDLAVIKRSVQTTVTPGGPLTYKIIVRNLGPSTVTSFMLNEQLPEGFTPLSYTTSSGVYHPGTGIWEGLAFAAGQQVVLKIAGVVATSAPTVLVNSATVAPIGMADPDLSNNSAVLQLMPTMPWSKRWLLASAWW